MSAKQPQELLKVKDDRVIGIFVVSIFLMPLAILFAGEVVFGSFLVAFAVGISLFGALIIWFARNAKKKENEFVILADHATVTFKKYGTYRWEDISTIRSYRKSNWPISRYPESYLEITLWNKNSFVIRTTSYNLPLEELEKKLKNIAGTS